MQDDDFDHDHDQELIQENESLKHELLMLGRDPSVFDALLPDEMNSRLRKSVAYAEEAREAELLGRDPPPSFLDPMSPHWIPDVDDMVHRSARQLLGDDLVLRAEEHLSDAEVAEQLHRVLDRLATQGVEFGIRETVPERIAYRYLMDELRDGLDIMPGWVIDGCSGDCEDCFQLPYCDTGRESAQEDGYPVPEPPLLPRVFGDAGPGSGPRRYSRWPAMDSFESSEDHGPTAESDDDFPF